MLRIIKKFNSENPDIEVKMQRMDWNTYYNKLFIAGIGKRAPEVFVIHTDVLERFIESDFIQNIDPFIINDSSFNISNIDTNIWATVARNNIHFGLPLDIHPLGMYYNKKLFREAGIVDKNGKAKPPTNREEFLDAVKKLTKDFDNDGKIDQWGFVFTWYRTNLYAMMKQFGGEFFTDNYNRAIVNNKENIEALEFARDLIYDLKVSPLPMNMDSWIGFQQGKVGIAFEGIYMLPDLMRQKNLEFGGAVIPKLGTVPATWGGTHNLCIKSNLSKTKQDAAWRLIKYISDNSLDWAEGGQVPARKDLRNTDRFHSMTIQNEFAKDIPNITYTPLVPFVFEFLSEFDISIEKILRHSSEPANELIIMEKKCNEIIERYNKMKKE